MKKYEAINEEERKRNNKIFKTLIEKYYSLPIVFKLIFALIRFKRNLKVRQVNGTTAKRGSQAAGRESRF